MPAAPQARNGALGLLVMVAREWSGPMRNFKGATLAALATGIILFIGPCGPMGALGVTVWLLETIGTAYFLAN